MKKIFLIALLIIVSLLSAKPKFRRKGNNFYSGPDKENYKVDINYITPYAKKVVTLVDSCLNTNQRTKAVQLITLSLRVKPKNPELLLKAGLMLLDMQNPKKALSLFEKSLNQTPRKELAKAIVVFTYYGGDFYKKYDRAIEILNKAKKMYPSFDGRIEQMIADLNIKKINKLKNK